MEFWQSRNSSPAQPALPAMGKLCAFRGTDGGKGEMNRGTFLVLTAKKKKKKKSPTLTNAAQPTSDPWLVS